MPLIHKPIQPIIINKKASVSLYFIFNTNQYKQ